MKRICALLLALVMILSLATTAFAATNDSITINNAKAGETYKIYKMLDLSVNDAANPTAYTYTVAEGWEAFFAEGGAGAAYVTINDAGAVTVISDAAAAALAKAAAEWSGKPAATQSVTVAEGATTAVFDGLENGYWLVTSTLGTIAMAETTPDASDVTINEKNPVDSITKKVEEDSTGEYGASNDAQIGDIVNFQSVITLHKGTRNVKVTDTMTTGLTYNKDAAIAGLTENTEYTISETDNGFVITFEDTYLNSLTATTELTLTYSATLNENAIADSAIVAQTNKIVIAYGDAQSVDATTTTTTYKFAVNKKAAGVEDLADAVFSLKKDSEVVKLIKLDDTNYRVANGNEAGAVDTFTTVASGDIVIWGVDADTDYTLEEIRAPEGYNKLTEAVKVEVKTDNSAIVDVLNQAGAELPSTGGVGTTMFYVIGGLMMLMAVVLLVTKKRMASAE